MENEKVVMLNIYQAIGGIMGELGPIKKDKQNKSQGFSYRGIDQLYNALNPLFSKYKVFCVPKVLERTTSDYQTKGGDTWKNVVLKVEYKLIAEDGTFVEGTVYGEGSDSGDKGTNKAMSACQKYFFFQTFVVPTDDIVDADKDTPPVASSAPVVPPVAEDPRLKALPFDIQGILRDKKFGVKQVLDFCNLHKWDNEKMRATLKPKTVAQVVAPVDHPVIEQAKEVEVMTEGDGVYADFYEAIRTASPTYYSFIEKEVAKSKAISQEQKTKLLGLLTARKSGKAVTK